MTHARPDISKSCNRSLTCGCWTQPQSQEPGAPGVLERDVSGTWLPMVLISILAGGIGAVAALLSGQSILMALGLYSGTGILAILLMATVVLVSDNSRQRSVDHIDRRTPGPKD